MVMFYSRCRSDWRKEHALTWGDPDIHHLVDRQEVSRSHSRFKKRAVIIDGGLTDKLKG